MGEREVTAVASGSPFRSKEMKARSIRKAVIPAAGLGTRMLPFTKAVPKEMLPIANRPLIQYAVDEAIESGIEEIVLVTSPRRETLRDYFRRDAALEQMLEQMGRHHDAELLSGLSRGAKFTIVHQSSPLGLGHAVACAKDAVGDEPFAVILPDALILGAVPCIGEMIAACEDLSASCVAAREVEAEDINRFGILNLQPSEVWADINAPCRVRGVIEKPPPELAPSKIGIFGRYLLEPEIFAFLDAVQPDNRGEIQLTAALAGYCRRHPLYAVPFTGEHYDVGSRIGYLHATIRTGLEDAATAQDLRGFLEAALSAGELCNRP